MQHWTTSGKSREPSPVPEQNIRAVAGLEQEALQNRSLSERVSDVLTGVIGTLLFIAVHLLWFATWILWNLGIMPMLTPFDPFPFGILTLIVSTEGVLLAIIILISQNRMTRQADRRTHLDLQMSVLSEQEMTLLLHMVGRISERLGVTADDKHEELQQLLRKTDVRNLMTLLESYLPPVR
jgi:uncharacterized membrane protein